MEDVQQLKMIVDKEIADKTDQLCKDYCFKCHPKFCTEKVKKDGAETDKSDLSEDDDDDGPVCDGKEGLTVDQFKKWIDSFETEDFVIKMRATMADLLK